MPKYGQIHIRYIAEKKHIVQQAKALAALENKPFGRWLLDFLEEKMPGLNPRGTGK